MLKFKYFILENNIQRLNIVHKNIIPTEHDPNMLKELQKRPGYSLTTHNQHLIDHLSSIDNTSDKKNTSWLVDQYKKKTFRHEDLNQIKSTLDLFNKHGKDLPDIPNVQNPGNVFKGSRLKTYQSPGHLQDALNRHLGVDTTIKEEDYNHPDADKIYDNNGYKVWHVKSEEAAKAIKKFDPGCRWCTASESNNMFEQYPDNLHILRTPDGNYYQTHHESNQFMDNLDNAVDKEKFAQDHPETLKIPALKYFKEFNTPEDYEESIAGKGHIGTLYSRVNSGNMYDGDTVLNHPKVNDEILAKVAQDHRNPYKLITHPKAGDKTLKSIVENTPFDQNEWLKLLNHEKAGKHTIDALAFLSGDKTPDIHRAIVKHPKASDLALSSSVAVATHGKFADTDFYRNVLKHPNARDNAIGNVAQYYENDDMHREILNGKYLNDHILSSISSVSKNPEIQDDILNHEKTGDKTLNSYVRYFSPYNNIQLYRQIMKHPKIGDLTLESMALRSDDPEFHKEIFNHQNIGPWTLGSLAEKTKDPDFHKAILNHPKSNHYILTGIAKNTSDPELQRKMLNHPKSNWLVYENLRDNPDLDPSLRKEVERKINNYDN